MRIRAKRIATEQEPTDAPLGGFDWLVISCFVVLLVLSCVLDLNEIIVAFPRYAIKVLR